MSTVERLYEEVMALSPAEREQLFLRLEIEGTGLDPDQVTRWDAEAEARLRRIDDGEPTVPWAEVRARMFERIRAVNP